ncbi:glycosyltransferase family 2 protein [Mediterraneibacter faecis]|uniref:glycosyltransferase family 2 protein n=1 Tax=Mediterraneibacter faecis TaxID=592978 RepID=UPI0018A9CE83
MELVSVVVPVYKVEQYLERCVKSICEQTYQELEIILVNDGSPDRCGEMCEELAQKDKRIQVLNKQNGGLSDARNAGVKLATGKYLLFVDSDDYIAKDLVEKTVTEAEKMACDMVLFDYYCVENGIEEVRTTQIPGGKVISLEKEHQLLLAPPAAWAKLFNREFYVKADCPFPKGLYFEDLATTPIFFLKAKRISYLKEPLYYYIIRENSIMTGKNYEKSSQDKMEVLDHILSVYRENGKYETYREELEYLVLANAYFEPSKELVLEGEDGTYLQKYRDYAKSRIGNVKNNKYINQWSRKDKLHLWILNYKQYWLMRLLSKARRMVSTKL